MLRFLSSLFKTSPKPPVKPPVKGPPKMILGLANASTLVTDVQAKDMAEGVSAQLIEDFAKMWHRDPASCQCVFVPGGSNAIALPGMILMYLKDDLSVPDALGYHDETQNGIMYAEIAVKPVLSSGGGILTAGPSLMDSVSAVVSHEAMETYLDPPCSYWVDGPVNVSGSDYACVAMEACDPVQAGAYVKHGVLVSDFVCPAYFDRDNLHAAGTASPYNFMDTLKSPLSVDAGGYLIVRNNPGSESQVFGEFGNGREHRKGSRRFKRGVK